MTPAAQEKKTLIIEDDRINTKLLRIIFKKMSSVETASDGREGLKKLKREHFDLVISDVEMPFMNGIEVMQELSKSDPDAGRRFIFFTGTANPAHINFLKENNFNYLSKPSPPAMLIDLAEKILKAS